MKIIPHFIFSMILVLVNHAVLAEKTKNCTNYPSGTENRCVEGNNLSNSKTDVLQLLQSLVEQKSIPSIIPFLKDSEAYVREAAIEALGQLGAKKAIPSIIPRMQDTDSAVRNKAINVLVQFHAREAIPSIISLLHEKDSSTKTFLRISTTWKNP